MSRVTFVARRMPVVIIPTATVTVLVVPIIIHPIRSLRLFLMMYSPMSIYRIEALLRKRLRSMDLKLNVITWVSLYLLVSHILTDHTK